MKLRKYLYKSNYCSKIIFLLVFSFLFCLFENFFNCDLFTIKITDPVEYHFKILTINSILSGFSLTNLGILISITNEELVKKLAGTDILLKRNILISYSIIFGSISIITSLIFVININIKFPALVKNFLSDYFIILEIVSLYISIFYFLLSLRKMLQLLTYLYKPQKKYIGEKRRHLENQLAKSIESIDEDHD